jgi:plastocyanin
MSQETEPRAGEEAAAPAEPAPAAGGGPEPRFGLPALAYPIVALLFIGILVFSFSRILLVVDEIQAAAIALLMALNILIGAALIAYGRRVRERPVSFPLLLGAAALVVAGGIVAFSYGDHPPEKAAGGEKPGGGARGATVQLTARGLKFEQTELTFPAGARVTVAFDNEDAGVPHNFVLFQGASATAPVIFKGDLVTGPGTANYSFTAPEPGDYFFHCEVHPTTMTGTAKVVGGGGPEPGGGGGPTPGGGAEPGGGPIELTAQNIAWSAETLHAAPGGRITVHVENKDQFPHDFAVFKDEGYTEQIFGGDPVQGGQSIDYTFPAPPPGTYFFRCNIHTVMQGTLIVGG